MDALPFSFRSPGFCPQCHPLTGCQQRTGTRQGRLEPSGEIKKTTEKGKPGLEHFSHLPLEQSIGFGCGFC